MYMTVKQAAEKWGISNRRMRILCAEGKISGVFVKDAVKRPYGGSRAYTM